MKKHTPERWKYRNIDRDHEGNKVHGGFLVDVDTKEVLAYVDARSEDEATKIVAAQDMLEAMEECLTLDAWEFETMAPPILAAAIAKARGEA